METKARNNPLVSCVIPSYNAAQYLGEAIESILRQSYQPLEILVIDDGSTDATATAAQGHGKAVHLFRQANRGPAAARNLGLLKSKGEFIAFLDADDLWEAEKIERQMGVLQTASQIDLSFTCFQNFWMPDLDAERRKYLGHPLAAPLSAPHIGTLLTHRSTFVKFGIFDERHRHGENILWLLQALRQGAVLEVLPETMMLRRLHQRNSARVSPEGFYGSLFPILKAWRDYRRGSS